MYLTIIESKIKSAPICIFGFTADTFWSNLLIGGLGVVLGASLAGWYQIYKKKRLARMKVAAVVGKRKPVTSRLRESDGSRSAMKMELLKKSSQLYKASS